ncbi:MAG: Re/Si-specific NAD(P)(+) transhydrogenase subunit alpha [Chloroflexi bacterium]|nr:MAG: Re/Si-specific NAD(P)(+) transhydrogenase subunit alpha [Chloroflexota bacterium]TMB96788.1 MAG: Re/Si-specific NAD(P)(+) transhydrogenase subunit alpha [Chloroflexota bacterium]TMC31524.1 MAG: Re/Si-specific NAD(P)(+) transhydrogenase subunit alpha [Chloroflexota bacterium]TMC36472.1 MAG: Re/Si-specific NAD(P)(+) transhydrogenase subunit alpha [Chloroflexota bacterium]TMC57928.1 MAG: Re/Si-specific NAD(P)(+) transhydrogenase subunit alpha [Chloroflexota bacterium]
MKIGVPKETMPGETRVGIVPETVGRLAKAANTVVVERGAGTASSFTDEAYEKAGAQLVDNAYDAELVVKVQRPTDEEIGKLRSGTVLIAFLQPLTNHKLVDQLARAGVTALSMDAIPRITRAQPMDALSSQATVAGYKAVLLAAAALPKFFPMLTTAAGTIAPAKALVIGAGVAGLQAIATARRLGAVVEAFDTRPVVKEQVQSLGAKFLEIDLGESGAGAGGYAKELSEEAHKKEVELLAKAARENDIVITTAAIPGRKAPVLITRDMIPTMKPGSVIVDLAAETGGNVEGTEAGKTIVVNGVTIIGQLNLPASMPFHASQMYSRNIASLLALMLKKDGTFNVDMTDEVVKGTVITKDGEVVHAATKQAMQPAAAAAHA